MNGSIHTGGPEQDPSRFGDAIRSVAQLSVAQLHCLRIDVDQKRLINIPTDQLEAVMQSDDGELWVDIEAAQPEDFRQLLEQLPLHPLILEDCIDPHRSSRFSTFDHSLHFEFPVSATHTSDAYLSVICVPGMLITIRTTRIPEIEELLERLDDQALLSEGTKAALLYTILDTLGDSLVEAAREARSQIRELSLAMDRSARAVEIDEIIAIKRQLQDIATIAEEQLFCIRSLVPVETNALAIANQRDYFRDAVRNYETALRLINRYESRTIELHQQYMLALQMRTESRIRILTILSAICMPLTLIAGVYGMNFTEMPELNSEFGYPLTIAVMFAIATGQLVFFYKRGWFR